MTSKIDRKTLELLVLGCWAHDEISIGRARELLNWTDSKIREQAEKRVSSAAKLKEERDGLESEVRHWKNKADTARHKGFKEAIDLLQQQLTNTEKS